MLGVCISIKRPIAAIPVSVANNVGNALRNPGCSIASRIVASAALGVSSKFRELSVVITCVVVWSIFAITKSNQIFIKQAYS
jgi:hypothetical protein